MNIASALDKFKHSIDHGIERPYWLKQLRDAYYEDYSKLHYRAKVVNWSPYVILATWLIAAVLVALLLTVVPFALPVVAALAAVAVVGAILTTVIMGKMRHNAYSSLNYIREQVEGDEELLNQNSTEYKLAGIMNVLGSKENYIRPKINKIFTGTVGQKELKNFSGSNHFGKNKVVQKKVFDEGEEKILRMEWRQKLPDNQKQFPQYLKEWHLTVAQYKESSTVRQFVSQYSNIIQMQDQISAYFSDTKEFGMMWHDWKKHSKNRIVLQSGFGANISNENWKEDLGQHLAIRKAANKGGDITKISELLIRYNTYLADSTFRKPLLEGIELNNGEKIAPLIDVAKRDLVDSESRGMGRSFSTNEGRI